MRLSARKLDPYNRDDVVDGEVDRFIVFPQLEKRPVRAFQNSSVLNHCCAGLNMDHHFLTDELLDNHTDSIIHLTPEKLHVSFRFR